MGSKLRGGPPPLAAVVADVEAGEAERVQTPGEAGVLPRGGAIEPVVDSEAGAELDADPLRTPHATTIRSQCRPPSTA